MDHHVELSKSITASRGASLTFKNLNQPKTTSILSHFYSSSFSFLPKLRVWAWQNGMYSRNKNEGIFKGKNKVAWIENKIYVVSTVANFCWVLLPTYVLSAWRILGQHKFLFLKSVLPLHTYILLSFDVCRVGFIHTRIIISNFHSIERIIYARQPLAFTLLKIVSKYGEWW